MSDFFFSVGPLVSTWCMRMEAKNSYFKKAAQIGTCFKNVSYSEAFMRIPTRYFFFPLMSWSVDQVCKYKFV